MAELEENEKIQEAKEVLLILDNIREGQEIGRFKFTNKELQALRFISNILEQNLQDLE